MLHDLKIDPEYIDDIKFFEKGFEIRKDDRPYEKGDYLWLRGWSEGNYTEEEVLVKVKYIYRGELCRDGYCIMATEVLDSWTVRRND